MATTLIELLIAPALVAISTAVSRRWGAEAGGVISAFPAIVGPVLLIAAREHGRAFAASAANGTLLGLVALSGFVLAYGWTARAAGWHRAMTVGWAVAGALGVSVYLAADRLGSPGGLVVGGLSLLLARRLLPRRRAGAQAGPVAPLPRAEIPMRMALTALLVGLLTLAANRLGPLAGGALASLPVLASVLAVFTHRERGEAALIDLLQGMLTGMLGFALFCELVAVLIIPAGAPAAFTTASLAAAAVSALTMGAPGRRYAHARFG